MPTQLPAAVESELRSLLAAGNHTGAMACLKQAQVCTLGERHRLISAALKLQQNESPKQPLRQEQTPHQQSQPPLPPSLAQSAAGSSASGAAAAIANGEVGFITLTNEGYLPYTANCLASLKRAGEPVPLTVYCVDKASFDECRRTHPHQQVVPLYADQR